ncbi:MAG: hypothetical protein ABI807_15505 [Sporichthyaceae bacterium]
MTTMLSPAGPEPVDVLERDGGGLAPDDAELEQPASISPAVTNPIIAPLAQRGDALPLTRR